MLINVFNFFYSFCFSFTLFVDDIYNVTWVSFTLRQPHQGDVGSDYTSHTVRPVIFARWQYCAAVIAFKESEPRIQSFWGLPVV